MKESLVASLSSRWSRNKICCLDVATRDPERQRDHVRYFLLLSLSPSLYCKAPQKAYHDKQRWKDGSGDWNLSHEELKLRLFRLGPPRYIPLASSAELDITMSTGSTERCRAIVHLSTTLSGFQIMFSHHSSLNLCLVANLVSGIAPRRAWLA